MAEFSELLITRRSVRSYRDEPVPLELIKELIKQSTMAPSSGNGQLWQFVIVSDKDLIKKISDESKKNLLASSIEEPEHPAKKYEGVLKSDAFNVFYNAPCLLLICGPKDKHSVYLDCSLAACYLMLAAADRGLGTCWINLGRDIRDKKMLEQLGIPETSVIVAPIILGYPQSVPNPPTRKEPEILKIID